MFFQHKLTNWPFDKVGIYFNITNINCLFNLCIAIHCDDQDSKGEATEQIGGCISFFAPLHPCHLWIGNEKSTSFAEKIKLSVESGKAVEFEEETELRKLDMYPGNLYIFSGGFPHGGGIYSENNVRVFFRVYTADRQGSNADQYYFEHRSLKL